MPKARRALTVGSVGGCATSFPVCLLQQVDKVCRLVAVFIVAGVGVVVATPYIVASINVGVSARVRSGSGGVSGGAAMDRG